MSKFEDIKEARKELLQFAPFIASFLFGLKSEVDNSSGNPTACTDGKSILYNESFIAGLNFKQLKTLIAHEVCHVAFCHHFRMRGKDLKAWNIATDHAINLLLTSMGFEPLKNWLCDPMFRRMSAEDIYKLIANQSQEQIEEQSKQALGDMQEPKNDDGDPMSEDELEQAKQEAKEKLQNAKGNIKRMMDSIDKSNMTEAEKQERKEICGKGLAEVFGEIDFESASRVCWREVLARFLSATANNDFAIHIPDRRFIADSEFLMPSLYSEEIGNIMFALDVSGSCAREAKQLAKEAKTVLEMMEGTANSIMKVCYCSDHVHRIDEIKSPEDIKLIYGGGTDFAPAIEAYAKDETCTALVYITDGFCYSFGTNPNKPVLWVLTRRNDYFNPSFGEVVLMGVTE